MAQKKAAPSTSGPQAPVHVGSVTLNLGLGVGDEYHDHYYKQPMGTKAAVEWGLWQAGPGTITLGGEIGASFSNGYYNDYRTNTIIVAMRSAWHYGWKVKGLDTYAGFSAGPGFHNYYNQHHSEYDGHDTFVFVGGFIGASYFVTPHFGFNTEAGFDITNFQLGIIFKLK